MSINLWTNPDLIRIPHNISFFTVNEELLFCCSNSGEKIPTLNEMPIHDEVKSLCFPLAFYDLTFDGL